ncbi:MAG: D-alanyl-D-alanine carboxypeptidase/D-alanyl-D-alanine-endopeptidase [Rhodoluna sp.]
MFAKNKLASIALSGALVFALTIPAAQAAPTPNPSPTETPIAPATCSASKQINKPALGKFYAYVVDVNTGHVLLDIRGNETTPSASVLKVLSVSAALTNLPADYTAKTSVLTLPNEPGTIVLQGGGDHTLSNMSKGSYTTYAKPARLETLATQVLLAWENKVKINKIILDASFFSGESYNSAWLASDRTNGYISKITGLQVDSDRRNPDQTSKAYDGTRSIDPIMRTGTLFKAALKGLVAKGAQLVIGGTPKAAVELTSVSSQPITTWMSHAIGISDNTETEFIARHAAKAAGLSPSFTSIQPMVENMLDELGIHHSGLVMKDASGLAQADRVTPKLITQLMAKVASGDSAITPLESYLPVAGGAGSLVGRFTGANAVARKYVRGKTGFIPGLYSLAGIIDAQDGSTLAYSMFARTADGKSVGWSTRSALDTVATRFFICGAGLGL